MDIGGSRAWSSRSFGSSSRPWRRTGVVRTARPFGCRAESGWWMSSTAQSTPLRAGREHQDETICAVTHNFVILSFLSSVLGIELAQFRRLRHGVAAIAEVDVGPGRSRVVRTERYLSPGRRRLTRDGPVALYLTLTRGILTGDAGASGSA